MQAPRRPMVAHLPPSILLTMSPLFPPYIYHVHCATHHKHSQERYYENERQYGSENVERRKERHDLKGVATFHLEGQPRQQLSSSLPSEQPLFCQQPVCCLLITGPRCGIDWSLAGILSRTISTTATFQNPSNPELFPHGRGTCTTARTPNLPTHLPACTAHRSPTISTRLPFHKPSVRHNVAFRMTTSSTSGNADLSGAWPPVITGRGTQTICALRLFHKGKDCGLPATFQRCDRPIPRVAGAGSGQLYSAGDALAFSCVLAALSRHGAGAFAVSTACRGGRCG
jgi:hypothetical protein